MKDPAKCVMHFKTTQGAQLRCFFDNLASLIHEGNLVFDKDGITFKGLSPDVYGYANLPAELLGSYICRQRCIVGIDFTFVFKLLRTLGPNDGMAIQIPMEQSPSVPLIYFHIINGNKIITHEYKMLDVMHQNFALEPKVFDCCVRMRSDEFQRYMRTADIVGGDVQFAAKVTKDEHTLHIYSEGDNSNMHVRVPFDLVPGDDKLAATSVLRADCDNTKNAKNPKNEADPEHDAAPSAPESTVEGLDDINGDAAKVPILTTLQRTSNMADRFGYRSLGMVAKCASMSNSVYIYLLPDYALVLRYFIGTLGAVTWYVVAKADSVGKDLEDLDADSVPVNSPVSSVSASVKVLPRSATASRKRRRTTTTPTSTSTGSGKGSTVKRKTKTGMSRIIKAAATAVDDDDDDDESSAVNDGNGDDNIADEGDTTGGGKGDDDGDMMLHDDEGADDCDDD